MLQRVQTVLMALIVVFSIILFFVPIYEISNALGSVSMGACTTKITILNGKISTQSHYMIAIIAVLGILSTSYSIMSYKNRPLQLKLSLLNTLIYLSLLGTMIYQQGLVAMDYEKFTGNGKYGFGIFVPAICLLLNMLSSRFIRKDERLIKDAFERIR